MANISIGITAHDDASSKLTGVGTAAETMGKRVEAGARDAAAGSSAVRQVGTSAESAASETSTAADRIKAASASARDSLRQIGAAGRDAASQTESSSKRTAQATQSMGEKFRGLGSSIAAVAGGMGIAALGSKIVDFAKSSVGALNDTALATTKLQQIMGGSATQVSSFMAVASRFGVTNTNLSTAMSTAEKQIVKNTSALTSMGVQTKNADGSYRSMSDMMPEIADKFSNIHNSTEKTALATEIFGRQGRALLPILDQGSAGLAKYEDEAKKSGDTLSGSGVDSARKFRMENAALEESVQGLQLRIGTALYPSLEKLVNMLTTKVVPAISEGMQWISKHRAAVEQLAKILGVAAGATLAFVGAMKGISIVVTAVKTFNAMVTAIKAFQVASKLAAAGQWLLNAAMDANPIGIVVIAIGALVAALVWFFTQTKVGKKVWTDLCSAIQTAWDATGKWLTDSFHKVADTVSGVVSNVVGFFRTAGNDISSAWNAVVGFFASIPGRIRGFFAGIGDWLVDAGRSLISGLIRGVESMIGSIGSTIGKVASTVVDGFKGLLGIHSPSTVFDEMGVNTGQGYINGLQRMAGKAAAAVKSLVTVPTAQSMGLSGMQLAGVTGVAQSQGGRGVSIGVLNAGNKSMPEIVSGLNFLAKGRGQS